MPIIEALTHHAMGRLADGTLVPRTLPGEEVEVKDDGSARIITPSPRRVAPPCRHFKTCGGCAMQHADDAFVADWKAEIVARALAGQQLSGEIAGTLTSPARSRRRAKFTGRRNKSGGVIGFKARGSDMLVEVPDCQLIVPEIAALMPALAEVANLAASRKAEAGLLVTQSTAGADLQVESERTLTPELVGDLARIAERAGFARITWGQESAVLRAPPVQNMGAAPVVPPPGSFLQATAEGENTLLNKVREAIGDASRVVDLFAGCGTFSLPLASKTEVHAVESVAPMIEALQRGWRAAGGLRKLTTEVRDLFRNPLLPIDLKDFDAAIIDPPRAGAEAQVRQLAAASVPVIAMVSCNPVTFARDARILVEAGFQMGPIWVVDQFRWSTHVELVTRFTRV
ncbi:class I SAM-dependent RNA methyltransferase [Ketogulonicigenium vulgare]|uniref:23S rRNA (Uracil-5-)-methyltransferase rumA n=1 Tax=Ketogulonicigenium vulgare (strain WSH-001) TaxID=759362 RepID=F9Y672_KETVW|nr:class I SAM-dependent RNA methyltransferase [Ketogulonicigenium vulgare]ADO43806.1 23S rRNA (Uracil-5-)-methyltransferase rumA [Ketogulonicigenium vulgare Y25]AEM42069.1 23S rRNA (Uracil-5-)-methyltransferase rumA [Ketogulonicigenium vulgare WSH-001]ALJ82162.1 RNA methyltransferase [Ketogulonicigenium vulgare]ANW34783.1 RNA methyltransferase [Ketogulonicigenium vulgare]AOZ55840.1 23S rRNA (Uracil-5-)-methyltransferase rumA [Ketogulonicigenium vulgare]